jgi:hypothetical protein
MESSVIRQIHRLKEMTVGELRVEWQRLYGEPSRSRNRDFLWRRLAWRVQEIAYGGLGDAAKRRLAELGQVEFQRGRTPAVAVDVAEPAPAPRPVRDLRLPSPGTIISRRWRDKELRLLVRDDGYELDGVVYRSLTEAARAATGSHWNGKLFWGVAQRKRRA